MMETWMCVHQEMSTHRALHPVHGALLTFDRSASIFKKILNILYGILYELCSTMLTCSLNRNFQSFN